MRHTVFVNDVTAPENTASRTRAEPPATLVNFTPVCETWSTPCDEEETSSTSAGRADLAREMHTRAMAAWQGRGSAEHPPSPPRATRARR